MNKGLIVTAALSVISAVVQLLPVLSVPMTGPSISYNLALAKSNGVAFGVFGICDYGTGECTKARIGYTTEVALGENEDGGVQLPSDARNSISKLLVVHVVAFALSSVLVFVTCIYISMLWMKERKLKELHNKVETQLETLGGNKPDGTGDGLDSEYLSEDNSGYRRSYSPETNEIEGIKRVDHTPFFNFQLTFSLLSCLFTLLGLLSDILLFVPHLSYLGWMQILPIVLLAVEATLVCFMKRSIMSRRHLDEEYFYANDDMRTHTRLDVIEDDDGSDDGFYVYTNGFYSNYGDREEHNQSQQSNTNSWRHHTPHNIEDDASINSSQLNRERIQLRDMTRSS